MIDRSFNIYEDECRHSCEKKLKLGEEIERDEYPGNNIENNSGETSYGINVESELLISQR